jgi:hypothetical protein
MSEFRVAAPTPGRVVMFDAAYLRPGARSLRVPAIVHNIIAGDRVTLWAVDDDGAALLAPDGGLPVADYGQVTGGVPSPGCWCWPTRSERVITVRVGGASDADTVPLRPFADEPPFTP